MVTAKRLLFKVGNEFSKVYIDKKRNGMRDEVAIARHAAWRLLGLRMGLFKRADFVHKGGMKKSFKAVSTVDP